MLVFVSEASMMSAASALAPDEQRPRSFAKVLAEPCAALAMTDALPNAWPNEPSTDEPYWIRDQ